MCEIIMSMTAHPWESDLALAQDGYGRSHEEAVRRLAPDAENPAVAEALASLLIETEPSLRTRDFLIAVVDVAGASGQSSFAEPLRTLDAKLSALEREAQQEGSEEAAALASHIVSPLREAVRQAISRTKRRWWSRS